MRVCGVLEKARVSYMIVGGIAAAYHGIERGTKDIDLVIEVTATDVQRVSEALKAGGLDAPPEEVNLLRKVAKWYFFNDIETHLAVHIWSPQDDFQQASFDRRIQVDFDGHPLWLASVEDMVLMKLQARRIKDILDLQGLWARQQGRLDIDYLRRWAEKLNLTPHLELFLSGRAEEIRR